MSEPTSEQSIFLGAIALTSPAARVAFPDEVCGEKSQLRAELDALLAAHDRLGDAGAPTGADDSRTQGVAFQEIKKNRRPKARAPSSAIYKLSQQIGEGGMGSVYMAAAKRHPIKHMVALKVIKPGMDSRQMITRFEAERQALALMDHPNIARVFDGGSRSAH